MEPLGKQGAHQNQDLEFKGYCCLRIQEQAAVCPAEGAVTNCPCFGRAQASGWKGRYAKLAQLLSVLFPFGKSAL